MRRDSCDFGANALFAVTYGGDAPPVHSNWRANCCSIVCADSGALPDYRLCLIVPETITCQREQRCLHGALSSAIKRLISHTHTHANELLSLFQTACQQQCISLNTHSIHKWALTSHTRLVAQSAFVYLRVKAAQIYRYWGTVLKKKKCILFFYVHHRNLKW